MGGCVRVYVVFRDGSLACGAEPSRLGRRQRRLRHALPLRQQVKLLLVGGHVHVTDLSAAMCDGAMTIQDRSRPLLLGGRRLFSLDGGSGAEEGRYSYLKGVRAAGCRLTRQRLIGWGRREVREIYIKN